MLSTATSVVSGPRPAGWCHSTTRTARSSSTSSVKRSACRGRARPRSVASGSSSQPPRLNSSARPVARLAIAPRELAANARSISSAVLLAVAASAVRISSRIASCAGSARQPSGREGRKQRGRGQLQFQRIARAAKGIEPREQVADEPFLAQRRPAACHSFGARRRLWPSPDGRRPAARYPRRILTASSPAAGFPCGIPTVERQTPAQRGRAGRDGRWAYDEPGHADPARSRAPTRTGSGRSTPRRTARGDEPPDVHPWDGSRLAYSRPASRLVLDPGRRPLQLRGERAWLQARRQEAEEPTVAARRRVAARASPARTI